MANPNSHFTPSGHGFSRMPRIVSRSVVLITCYLVNMLIFSITKKAIARFKPESNLVSITFLFLIYSESDISVCLFVYRQDHSRISSLVDC